MPPDPRNDGPPDTGDQGSVALGTEAAVERTRAWTGLLAVVTGDVLIAGAAIAGVVAVQGANTSSEAIVSVLSSGFTAIGTLTTAYFGIKASANTAKASLTASSLQPPGSRGQ